MPNRILKESICTSENVDQLTPFQETFFYRLMVNCDDYGRMDARTKILSSRLFPLKEVKSNQIEDAIRALVAADLVILYEVDGKPYLQMKTWDKHQQVRAKKSKYPSPDEGICNQMISNDYETKFAINKREFYNCIDRASLFIKESDKKPIILNIENSSLYLKIDSSYGSMNEELEINKEGKDIRIGFNPKFLMDALKVIDDDNVDIYMTNSKSPCYIKNDEAGYTYLILPVSISA